MTIRHCSLCCSECLDLLPNGAWQQLPPSAKNVTVMSVINKYVRKLGLDVPGLIIAHLTRQCGENV
jgi:hypothetical protein